MKITKTQLRNLIKETIDTLNESAETVTISMTTTEAQVLTDILETSEGNQIDSSVMPEVIHVTQKIMKKIEAAVSGPDHRSYSGDIK
jgi:hypothetical protein